MTNFQHTAPGRPRSVHINRGGFGRVVEVLAFGLAFAFTAALVFGLIS